VVPLIVLLISGCVEKRLPTAPKTADGLAKDWREQVRKNQHNMYEGYPADNDNDYRAPRVRQQRNEDGNDNYWQGSSPISDNDSSNYGRFPRYNPDDDNVYLDAKDYPLYMD